jgi:hypothetical protein
VNGTIFGDRLTYGNGLTFSVQVVGQPKAFSPIILEQGIVKEIGGKRIIIITKKSTQ